MRRDDAPHVNGRFAEPSQCARPHSSAFVRLIICMYGIGFPVDERFLEKNVHVGFRRAVDSDLADARSPSAGARASSTPAREPLLKNSGPKSDISRIGRSRYPQRAKRIGRIHFPGFRPTSHGFSRWVNAIEERRCSRFRLFSCRQKTPALARQDDDCRRGRRPRRAGSRSFKAPDPTGACWIDCRAHRAWKAINRAIRSGQGRSGSSADVRLFLRIRMSRMVFFQRNKGIDEGICGRRGFRMLPPAPSKQPIRMHARNIRLGLWQSARRAGRSARGVGALVDGPERFHLEE